MRLFPNRRGFMATAAASLSLALLSATPLHAQTPLRVLVGFPPGGGTDAIARILAERL